MMNLKALLNPALYVMNKLSFKSKIFVSISILFLLLILPSRTILLNYIEESNTYKKQIIGLEYIQLIQNLIRTVQIHRADTNGYLNGNKEFKEKLQQKEELFYLQKSSLLEYDAQQLNILSSYNNFVDAVSAFELVTQEKLVYRIGSDTIFKEHTEIITLLLKSILDISQLTSFNSSKDLRVNYLAEMIQDELLAIYEYTAQLQAFSTGMFSKKTMTTDQKKVLFSLSTNLSKLQSNLTENESLKKSPNYMLLQQQTIEVSFTLQKVLKIIDEDVILNQNYTYNSETFSKQVGLAMGMQEELFKMFIYTYKETITDLQNRLQEDLWYVLLGFILILLLAFYIFIAFYQSITINLRKLQKASELISTGQTNIHLNVTKKDEIGDALLAFNTMSDKLSENISFLDSYKKAIDNSSIVSKTDLKGIITYANDMFCEVSGYSREELIGRSHNIVRHPDMPESTFEGMWKTIQNKKPWKSILKNRKKNGQYYIVDATILPILDSKNEIIEYVAVRHDITELEKSKEEIKKQKIDLLTGLPNRNQLLEDLKTATKPILFYLNIDNFSGFNDFYGSPIGDKMLLHLSSILKQIRKENKSKLYKLQADQFILLFEESYLAQDNFQYFFEELIERIETEIVAPIPTNRNRISISLTGGGASYEVNDDYQQLLLYCNIARKKAQKEHKKILLFNHSMRKTEDYAHNIKWIKRIKEAIDEKRIVTYYQAIVDNKTGATNKYESLVRMLDRKGQPVSTFFFLEIAKKANLYPQITKLVIDQAFEAFADFPTYQFSVNLTIDDILSKETTNYIYQKLESYTSTQRVIFEITESEEVQDYKVLNEFIKRVRQYDVQIAIDDFGSGYANFEHILNIDADFIKIDGTLVKNLSTDENSKIITEAIISFSKKLGRKTITEFVHNEEVYEIVKELGADYSQGFYFSIPSPKIT
jgi:PAS domain S-box-containing protein